MIQPQRVALGVAIFNDIRGPLRTTGAQFTYAYHIEDHYGQLSFGLTGSFFQLFADREKMITEHYDQFLMSAKLSRIIPDAIFGVHYTTPDYYAGLSVSNLFQTFLDFGGQNSRNFRIERQYLFLGGYIFEINRTWSFVPSLQAKFNDRLAAQIDVNLLTYYYDKFWGGVAYRTGGGRTVGGANLIFGVRHDKYHFGYSFDYSVSNLGRYSYGSHELMFSMTFGQTDNVFFRFNIPRRYEFQQIREPRGMRH
jgi:type IX secretion system PorP/SprF family membrane protein